MKNNDKQIGWEYSREKLIYSFYKQHIKYNN